MGTCKEALIEIRIGTCKKPDSGLQEKDDPVAHRDQPEELPKPQNLKPQTRTPSHKEHMRCTERRG